MSPKSLSTPTSRDTTHTACCACPLIYAGSMLDTWTPLRNPKSSLTPLILYVLMDNAASDTTSHAGQLAKPLRRQKPLSPVLLASATLGISDALASMQKRRRKLDVSGLSASGRVAKEVDRQSPMGVRKALSAQIRSLWACRLATTVPLSLTMQRAWLPRGRYRSRGAKASIYRRAVSSIKTGCRASSLPTSTMAVHSSHSGNIKVTRSLCSRASSVDWQELMTQKAARWAAFSCKRLMSVPSHRSRNTSKASAPS